MAIFKVDVPVQLLHTHARRNRSEAVEKRAVCLLPLFRQMPNVFFAGRELVRWDLTAVGANGPYRLTIQHAHGSIVEYFSNTAAALTREQELEDLLIAARGGVPRGSALPAR
jgi:hypothetical protein